MARTVEGRSFDNIDEVNAFLQSEEGEQAIRSARPRDRWEQAQELAYDAWESEGPRRYALAERALEVDSRCSDAWLILAERERSWRKQKRCFERAVAAADRAYDEEGWQAAVGEGGLYHHVPARSHLRAYMALARLLLDGGYLAEARGLYEKMMDRDPEDHMGVRYELLRVLHQVSDRAALRALLDRFREDDTTFFAYERLWLALAEGEDEPGVRALLEQAAQANPHVLSVLRNEDSEPDDGKESGPGSLSGYVAVGGKEEAVAYLSMAVRWWLEEPKVFEWLRKGRRGGASAGTSS